METGWKFERTDGCVNNMANWTAVNKENEEYLIQVSWPLEWSSTGEPPAGEDCVNVM